MSKNKSTKLKKTSKLELWVQQAWDPLHIPQVQDNEMKMMVMKMRMMMVMVMWWARCEWAPGNKRKFGEQSGQKGASTVLKKKVKGT